MSIALSVNLNKIALIRNSRPGNYPSLPEHGKKCLDYGAQGLTVHPRPDQRHIRPSDVRELSTLIRNYPHCEFNIEGNPFAPAQGSYPGLMALVESTQPHQCTLVPDSHNQATSDHGFDLTQDGERLVPIIDQLHALGVRVSLFMDPDKQQIRLAKDLGAERIELYTGPFAQIFEQKSSADVQAIFATYCDAAEYAQSIGIGVNAGHDLNLNNMVLFATLPNLLEVSIGHALTVESMDTGLQATIESYIKICS